MRPFLATGAAVLAAAATALTASPAVAAVACTARPADPVGYYLRSVKADQVAVPASAPAIAILDSGVADVPELRGRLRVGANVVNGTQVTNDIDGHGTAVATIAAGAAGGVRGVSPTSPIIPIKIFDDRGEASAEDFVAGIERAVALDAGVINVSAAGLASDVDARTARAVQEAINGAVSLGIPVIAPSGNEGASSLAVPAAYPHVIAVGATDEAGGRAPFSNVGSGLDLVAPGAAIVTAAPAHLCSSGYGTQTGTSFAAPLAAGAAALLLQRHPDLDSSQLTDLLRLRGVRSPAPAWTVDTGFGPLDVQAALGAQPPAPDTPEVNDDISWAKLQPPVLTTSQRSRTVWARIAPHKDPVDVYRVRLKRGDRLSVALRAPAGTSLRLGFGATRLASKRGRSFKQRIRRTGTYYVGATLMKAPEAGSGYALTLRR